MRPHIAFIISSIHVFTVTAALRDMPGYVGANVTLASGADPSWNLSKIEWSIFSNSTWIATYRKGTKNIERLSRFKGRLSLNVSSGDLTIHRLTSEDSMDYTVVLINTKKSSAEHRIRLKVMQHLVEPSVETVLSAHVNGRCWVMLHCSSEDEDISLSWEVNSPLVNAYNISHADGKPGGLLASFSSREKHPEFTCISSRTTERTATAVTPACPDVRVRCGLWSLIGLTLGFVILLIYIFREKIKALWENLKSM